MRDCYYDRKKSSSLLSGGCAIVIMTEKKSSSRLSGGCGIIITTGKKRYSCLSGGCVIVNTTGKKDTVVYLAGARSKNIDRIKKDTVIWLCTYVGNNGVGNGHFFFLDVKHTTINIPRMTWHRETHRKPSEEYSIFPMSNRVSFRT